jgi:hypothetical protein
VKRALKMLLVCTMLALIPLRGLAAVTVGICAAEHGTASHGLADHDHDGKSHDCSACAEHCTGATFVTQAMPASLLHAASTERAVPAERFAAWHVPEHLDPPPLAL